MSPIPLQPPDSGKRKALSIAVRYDKLAEKFPHEDPPLRLEGTHHDPLVLRQLLIGELPCALSPGNRSDHLTNFMPKTSTTTMKKISLFSWTGKGTRTPRG
jgi:hypothetical protein